VRAERGESTSAGLPDVLSGSKVELRPLRVDDVERIAEIQAEPYWRAPDGSWRDGLLMDPLAREYEAA
jgi:hypothetical protein